VIFHPLVIALYVSSGIVSFLILYAAGFGMQILLKWDLKSGSELQLALERKTYLISTLLAYGFGTQLLSLFLFIFTADQLHPFFVGAMCAAGTLYVNGYGYPALILKIINFLSAGIWLLVNHVDNQGVDYPLIRKKYLILLFIAPLILLEAVLQTNYFLRLRPDLITSCCGTLFSGGGKSLAADITALPSLPMKLIFYLSMFCTLVSGIYFYRCSRGGYLFAGMSALTFIVSLLSILSFISLYVYELPTHHCPFCILQGGYGYIGYYLYLTILGGTLSGMGVGILAPFRNTKSLSKILPSWQRKLALTSVLLFLTFTIIVSMRIMVSDLILQGY
jgi:hypothetical protein